MPAAPYHPDDDVYFYDQLEFGILARANTSTRLLRDYTICTPFLAQPWLDFMLSLPTGYRQKARLYQEIQKAAFGRLFSLPGTTYGGGSVLEPRLTRSERKLRPRVVGKAARMGLPLGPLGRAPAPTGANAAIRGMYRRPGPIRGLVAANLADLAQRGVVGWFDVASVLHPAAVEKYDAGRHVAVHRPTPSWPGCSASRSTSRPPTGWLRGKVVRPRPAASAGSTAPHVTSPTTCRPPFEG
jgi:hypothetical protein